MVQVRVRIKCVLGTVEMRRIELEQNYSFESRFSSVSSFRADEKEESKLKLEGYLCPSGKHVVSSGPIRFESFIRRTISGISRARRRSAESADFKSEASVVFYYASENAIRSGPTRLGFITLRNITIVKEKEQLKLSLSV